jgi:hypothetical protein
MSPHEVADIRRKPGFTAIAPIMRTSLIRPLAAAAAGAQDVWGPHDVAFCAPRLPLAAPR